MNLARRRFFMLLATGSISGWSLLGAGCGADAGDDGSQPDGSSPVLLNELLASNDAVLADESGEFDDWLELYNQTDSEVDLSGWLLSGGPVSAQEPFALSAGTSIAAAGYLVVWADDDPEQGALHADFKLARIGETLALYDPSGDVADSVTFPEQQTDVSWARQPDGSGDWQALTNPSPGLSNE